MIIRISFNEKGMITALCCTVALLMVKNILYCIPAILAYQSVINFFVAAVVMIMFVTYLPHILSENKICLIVVAVCFVCFVCLQWVIFPNNRSYLLESIPKIIIYGCIPFIYVCSVNNYERLIIQLKYTAYIIIIAAVVGINGIINQSIDSSGYNMAYGSSVMIGVVIIEYYALIYRKPIDIVFFVIGLTLLVVGSSRSALVCVGTFFIICYILLDKKYIKYKKFKVFCVSSATVLFISCYMSIANELMSILSSFGIRSRNLEMLIEGEFVTNNTGRDNIYEICLSLIKEHPFLGIGYEGFKGLNYTDLTPHNTYLELLLFYGVIIGGILIILLVVVWIKGITIKDQFALQSLVLIFACLYIPKSFVGARILENICFWVLLGLCINAIRCQRNKRKMIILENRYE